MKVMIVPRAVCVAFGALVLLPEAAAETAKERDRIVGRLPGLTFDADFVQYTGDLQATPNSIMRYWLVEAETRPADAPLVLWLGGGPGSSSIGNLFSMSGPFRVNRDGRTLFENPFAWTKAANMLYLESPAGVGWSRNADANYTIDDDQTAQVNYLALVQFFERFPEYTSRQFFVTSLSYGGVYGPTLALRILQGIRANHWPATFAGLAMGNPVHSEILQHNSLADFMYVHGIIGTREWDELKTTCCNATCPTDCNFYRHMRTVWGRLIYLSDGSHCGNLTYRVTEFLQWGTEYVFETNDMYNLYQDCYDHKEVTHHVEQSLPLLSKFRDTARHINYDSTDSNDGYPCWTSGTREAYINQPEVRKALKIDLPWHYHNSDIYNKLYQRQYYEMQSHYAELFAAAEPFRLLIYVGDVDTVCNFLGVEWFVDNVTTVSAVPVTEERKPWFYRGEIAGYVKRWQKLDLLTVKGAGHLVTVSKAAPALQMINNFLFNEPYSKPTGFNVDLRPLVPPYASSATSTRSAFGISFVVLSILLFFCRHDAVRR